MIVEPANPNTNLNARGRSTRIRFAPQHLTYETERESERNLSPEEAAYERELRATRDQLEQMKQMNRNSMHSNACPLLCADAGMDWPPPTHSLDELAKVQPAKKGMASDGYEYDLERLKTYIRVNRDRALLSPVTGEPINTCITFTVKGHSKKDPSKAKLKSMNWTPGIHGQPDKIVPA
jgi:hypothetical protein